MTEQVAAQSQAVPGITSAAPEAGAPAAAPVAPAAPVVAALTVPDEPAPAPDLDTSVQFDYDPTGDAGLDYALGYIGRLGYGTDHPAVAACRAGNFGLLKAELAGLGPKAPGYAEVIALAEQAYANNVKTAGEKDAKLGEYCVSAAGSPENWQAVQGWASANADPAEKQQINAALAQGGLMAEAAVNMLVQLYSKSNTLPQEPASAVRSDANGTAPSGGGALTAAQYGAAVAALSRANGGRDMTNSQEYVSLQTRRLQGRSQGI